MKTLKVVALGVVTAMVLALPASANNNGLAVTGTVAFGANGSAGGQYWFPQNAIIGGGVEFSYSDRANIDSADFSASQLHIQDQVLINANGWEMTFTTPGGFTGLSLVSSTFAPGLTYSLSGGKIVLDWVGTGTGPHNFDAVFNVSAVPEPGSYGMLLAGLGGLGFLARRKTKASA